MTEQREYITDERTTQLISELISTKCIRLISERANTADLFDSINELIDQQMRSKHLCMTYIYAWSHLTSKEQTHRTYLQGDVHFLLFPLPTAAGRHSSLRVTLMNLILVFVAWWEMLWTDCLRRRRPLFRPAYTVHRIGRRHKLPRALNLQTVIRKKQAIFQTLESRPTFPKVCSA